MLETVGTVSRASATGRTGSGAGATGRRAGSSALGPGTPAMGSGITAVPWTVPAAGAVPGPCCPYQSLRYPSGSYHSPGVSAGS